jgi:HEAT repeat protein
MFFRIGDLAFSVYREQRVVRTAPRLGFVVFGEDREEAGSRVEIESEPGDLVPVIVRAKATAGSDGHQDTVLSGDDAFDDHVTVRGSEREARSILDAPTRRVIRDAVGSYDLELRGGLVRAFVPVRSDRAEAAVAIRLLVDAAGRLRRKRARRDALAHNAREDTVAAVRAENVRVLAAAYPSDDVTAATLRAACDDPSVEVRVRAAAALGEAGRATLMEVAEEEQAEDVSRAQAIFALGAHLPFDRGQALLKQALRTRQIETALACLAAIGRSRDLEGVATVVKVMALEKGDVAAAAARTLGALRTTEAEAALIGALSRDEDTLRLAAAGSLGRVGTARAVLPLTEAESAHAGDQALRRAARQAVAEIQSRLPGASPGQLSLASGESGALSLANDRGGQLSLDSAQAGARDETDPRPPRG